MRCRREIREFLRERSGAVVEGWYRAVRDSAVALRSPPEVRNHLSVIWDQSVAFLLQEDASPQDAEAIGASFARLRIRPRAVGWVLRVLMTSLNGDRADGVPEIIEARLPDLMAGMTAGLVRTDAGRLLEQQEEIRAAYARSLQRIEQQLRIKEAGVEGSINGIMMVNLNGEVTYVNPAFLRMWGYENDREVLGRNVFDLGEWQGDDSDCPLVDLVEKGGWVGELVAVRADGSRFDVQASVSLIQRDAGRPRQLMAFFVDITERKETQRALQRRAKEAEFLNKIGEEIAGERTAEGVLERAVHLAQEAFGFRQVSVMLLDREREELVVAALASPLDHLEDGGRSLRLGIGITGWVAQHNQTVVANDVSADPRYVVLYPELETTKSELTVPICRGEDVTGVLDVQSPNQDAFGESEQVVLETLADQIAVALENARLYRVLQDELTQRRGVEQALRRSVQRLETVHAVDQAILGAKSREEVAQAVVHHLHRLVPCQRASIELCDWEADQVIVLAAIQTVGEGRAGTGTRFPFTQGMWLLDLWRRRELADVPDARELPQTSPLIQTVIDEGIRSFLAAPIGFRGELMGLLTLGSDQLDGFEPEHRPIIEELADTVAIAIQQARLFDSVKQQRERLRRTMARLAEAEEMERRRVVRELHDQVGQNLTALDLNLSTVGSQLECHGLRELSKRLDDSLLLVEQTNERIRQLMIDLRPPVLDDYGLLSTLHWYGDRFSKRTGIAVTVEGREEAVCDLSPHVENALFRIAQEALNNTAKHAQADEVTIALNADEAAIRLTIRDNGVGFELGDRQGERDTWGLLTMSERAESVGARCFFDSASGEGTRVVVEVPRRDLSTSSERDFSTSSK